MSRPLPKKISDQGLLVAWSLEEESRSPLVGFQTEIEPDDDEDDPLEPILHTGDGHLLTVAPTGAGKGVCCIIPALLRYKGPVITIDPKGENVAVTARRRQEMGQTNVVLDPFNVATEFESDRLNPFDLLDLKSPDLIDNAAMIAGLMSQGAKSTRDPFWDQRAEQLLTALVLHVAASATPANRNLKELRRLAYLPPEALEKEMKTSGHPEVQALTNMIVVPAPETLGGILAHAQSHVEFLRGELTQDATAASTFSLDDITTGKPLSIYIVLPPDKLESHSKLLRMWIGTFMAALFRRRFKPELPTLFLLDEAAQLGSMPALRQAMTLLRGYGVRTWSFWQDFSQLRLLYPQDWETMYNNCQVHQCFGLTTLRAADAAQAMTGFASAYDILGMDSDEMLLSLAGDEPVIAQKPNYLTDPVFAGQFDQNPYHVGSSVTGMEPSRPQRVFKRLPREAQEKVADPNAINQLITRLTAGPKSEGADG